MKITIIGGGPINSKASMSIAGFDKLKDSSNIIFQSERQMVCQYAEKFKTLDEVFSKHDEFEEFYEEASSFIQEQGEGVVFVAIGDGVQNGIVKQLIYDVGRENVEIITGAMPNYLIAEQIDGKLSLISSYDAVYFQFDTDLPTYIYEIDSSFLFEDVRLNLLKYYGESGTVYQNGMKTTVSQMENMDCELFLPRVGVCNKNVYTYKDLENIVATLRVECPWDREQTHESIRVNLVEECFELLEALDSGDVDLIIEEMGDALLQVALHNQIEVDSGYVDKDEVTTAICQKMIRRHPHIYNKGNMEGLEEVKSGSDVKKNWEEIKREEYGLKNETDVLKHVSNYIPSMVRANKLLKKAEKFGFDFEEFLGEDIYALFDRFMQKKANKKDAGNLLIAIIDNFRKQNMDAFMVLNDANNEFIVDFQQYEAGK